MLDFSLSITAVVSTAASAFVLWDCMKTSLSALTARKCDSGPMESHTSILIISLSYLGYKLCPLILYMRRRCTIEKIMYMSLGLSRMFLMAPIISLYSTQLFPVVRTIPSSTFPMNATFPLVFRQTVLLHSRNVIRHVGLSYFSITISPWNMFPEEILHSHCHGPRPQKALGLGLILLATCSGTDPTRAGNQGFWCN